MGEPVNDRRAYYRKVYLKSPHWKMIKRVMFEAYPRCQVCGSQSTLDVHHRCYRNLYDVSARDLIVLCRRHHDEIHRLKRNGKSPNESEVELNLRAILPAYKDTPYNGYIRLAIRFFKRARQIEQKFGIKLQSKRRVFKNSLGNRARKALSFSEQIQRASQRKNSRIKFRIEKPIRIARAKAKHEYHGRLKLEWDAYASLAKRLLKIARRLQVQDKESFILRVRRLCLPPEIPACTPASSVLASAQV